MMTANPRRCDRSDSPLPAAVIIQDSGLSKLTGSPSTAPGSRPFQRLVARGEVRAVVLSAPPWSPQRWPLVFHYHHRRRKEYSRGGCGHRSRLQLYRSCTHSFQSNPQPHSPRCQSALASPRCPTLRRLPGCTWSSGLRLPSRTPKKAAPPWLRCLPSRAVPMEKA